MSSSSWCWTKWSIRRCHCYTWCTFSSIYHKWWKMKFVLFNQNIGVVRCLYVLSMVFEKITISSSLYTCLLFLFPFEYFSFFSICACILCTYLFQCIVWWHFLSRFLFLQLYDNIHPFVFRMISLSFYILLSSRISCVLFFSHSLFFFSVSVFLLIVFVVLIESIILIWWCIEIRRQP